MDFAAYIMWVRVKLTSDFAILVEGVNFFPCDRDNLRAVIGDIPLFLAQNQKN